MKPFEVEVLPVHSVDDPELVVMDSHYMSVLDKVASRDDLPDPVMSLSPKSSRSGHVMSLSPKSSKSGRGKSETMKKTKRSKSKSKKKRSKKDKEAVSPRSPSPPISPGSQAANTRSPPRSPRAVELPSDISREQPEATLSWEPPEVLTPNSYSAAGSVREDREDRFFHQPTNFNKGVEPPDELPIVLPFLDNTSIEPAVLPVVLPGMEPPEMQTLEVPTLGTPQVFKKSKSSKSTRSMAGSRAGSRRSSSKRRKAAAAVAEVADGGNALQGVFSGHLMKWRFEAEEGGPFLRIPAFLGANALISTTTYALIFNPDTWTILSIVLALVIYAVSLLSVVLEGRFMCSNPLGIRAHLRSALTRKNRLFRFVWGRGVLYMLAGALSCALLLPPTIITGVFMITVGFSAAVTGGYSSRMFYLLRDSLKDDEYLASVFKKYDADKDGFVTLPEFVNLLSALGMDLDDRVGIKAFHAADINHEYKISEEAFISWWKTAFLKNGKAQKFDDIESDAGTDEEEGAEYQRMS